LAFALLVYAAIAALAIKTLDDPRIRSVTLLILGMFAVKSWVRRALLALKSCLEQATRRDEQKTGAGT